MNKFIVALMVTILFVESAAYAQTQSFTLEEIVQKVRSNSPAWLRAETQKERSYWGYKMYRSQYSPQLELRGQIPTFDKSVRANLQEDGSTRFGPVHNNRMDLGLYLNQTISPTGGRVYVYSDVNRYDNFLDTTLLRTQYSGVPLSIGIEQPIFQFNPYKWDKLIQPLEYEESQKQYFEELELISVRATQYFFDLYLAQIELEIANKNVANNDTIYKIAQGRYNLGKITENDLLQLELSLVNSRLAVSQAEVGQQGANLRLRSYVGLEENIEFKLLNPENVLDIDIDENVALAHAKRNRAEMVGFKKRTLESEQQVAREKSQGGLSMDLFARYGLNNQGSALPDIYQNPGDNIRIGLSMAVPILDWGRQKARLMRAKASQRLTLYTIEQEEITFDQDVLTQIRSYKMLRAQLDSRVRSDEIAQKAYGISKQLFLIAKIPIIELNQALLSKDTARKNYIQSLREYWVAYYQVRQKTLYDFENNQLLVRDIDVGK